jgi:hypothetical protein
MAERVQLVPQADHVNGLLVRWGPTSLAEQRVTARA